MGIKNRKIESGSGKKTVEYEDKMNDREEFNINIARMLEREKDRKTERGMER